MTDWNNTPMTTTGDLTPPADEPQLSVKEVKDLLLQLVRADPSARYPSRSGARPNDPELALVNAFAIGMPENLRYASVLTRMDRRQLYAQVMAPGASESKRWNGMEFTPEMRALAADWYMSNSDDTAAAAEAVAEMQVQQGLLDPARKQEFIDDLVSMRRTAPTVIREAPQQVVAREAAAPGTVATEALAGEDSPDLFTQMFRDMLGAPTANDDTKPAFLTDADVQALFRLSGSDLGAVNAYLGQLGQYRANVDPNFADPFRVDMEARSIQQTGGDFERRLANANASRAGGSSYTLSESVNLLYGMTPGEVRAIQEKLQRAGYFQTSGETGDEPLFWGDPTDARTQAAWRNLIGDAVRTGEPVYDMLDRRMRSALESGMFDADGNPIAERADVRLSDPAALRATAAGMARQLLGRDVTDDEADTLVDFIHSLETRTQNAMSDAQNRDGSQTVTDVDINAQIEEYLRRENPVEAEGREVALTFNDFQGLLAGPGRGGSF